MQPKTTQAPVLSFEQALTEYVNLAPIKDLLILSNNILVAALHKLDKETEHTAKIKHILEN